MYNPFNRFFRKEKKENEQDLPLKGKEDELELEIKLNVPHPAEEKTYENLPPYEPTLDLRNYKFPETSLFQKEEYFKGLGEYSNSLTLPILFSIKDNKIIYKDLTDVKNLLIAGTQATGKTNLLHQIILSFLFTKHPSQLKLILVDPKQIEFNIYRLIEKHFLAKLPGEEGAIVTDTKKMANTLNALCIEMDNRYYLLKEAGTRNIKEYNEKFIQRKLNPQKGHQYLPYLILLINDIASYGRVENNEINIAIQRLVNDGYKVGQYNILSTSQMTNEIMPSNLLASIGHRVAFRLNSKDEYKKVFDTVRLNRFLKEGEFLYNENAKIQEGQSLPIAYSEIENVVEFIGKQRGYPQTFLLPEYVDEKEMEGKDFDIGDRDSLFEDAARLIVQYQIGSTSLLQRRMKLGYNRSVRLMDQLEAGGIVGPIQGSKARDVLIKTEMELQQHLDALG